ncbi:65-kDa microtubule-associated protein 7-like isoform X2 [Phalaenopsis equestris]|uniref:65-kDa microtubule-associated protein 7-like isoform X2 n=1 Tax=Phalaenopsis equestris TaxID=78828 RepID=UPI0009E51175|nr:65-kDa microtubule-associated protein 7-like isoform X2 [Phalaenopsis equestris]
MRKLNEFQTQLHALQKEKLERVQKVLDYTNEVHSLCGVLGLEFRKIVAEVHPSLRETSSGECTNISTRTLDGLFQTIEKLKEEKKFRTCKLRDNLRSLLELWKLMDSSEKEKHHFGKFTRILDSPYGEITEPSLLSFDIIKQIETEVERLKKLKASRMKELVLKRRLELEEVCRGAHIEPDMSTAPEKTVALIDSGLVDPTELVANIEAQIMKAREESISRKEILDRIGRWLAAREEENWLEEYSQDGNRYSAGKGAHLNLKRAEKARVTVNRIPDNLILKTFAWEGQKRMPFLYDGVRLISILEEYRLNRQQKEAAKRQYRERKKLHSYLEKESLYGSQPSPRRHSSFDSKATGYHMNGNRPVTQSPQKLTSGCTTPGFRRPQSYSSHQPFGHIRRLSSPHLNFINLPREDTSSSFASISGSEPEALSLG